MQNPTRPRHRYSRLYDNIAKAPELAKFRRFLGLSSWMLYDDAYQISKLEKECNDVITEVFKFPRGETLFTVTDLHRASIRDFHPILEIKIEELKQKVRKYNKSLCLAHAVAQLPDQAPSWAEQFPKYDVFEDGLFGPTGEKEQMYKKFPPDTEFCSLRDLDEPDPVTSILVRHIKTLKTGIGKLSGLNSKKRKPDQDLEAAMQEQETMDFAKIQTMMNVGASLYAPVFFTSSMGVLACISLFKVRIVILGVFGVVLTTSMNLLVPKLKRNEIFAITAAYFAVCGIYVGSMGMVGIGGGGIQ